MHYLLGASVLSHKAMRYSSYYGSPLIIGAYCTSGLINLINKLNKHWHHYSSFRRIYTISFNCRTVGSTDKQSIYTLSCIIGLENMHGLLNVYIQILLAGIKLDTKLKVYKAVDLPTLLYACETGTSCKETSPFPLKLLEKAVKYQVARQDSRHRGPKESRDAKHAYSLKASTAKVDWPCYTNA